MREEQKLARNVYLALVKKWNLQIFTNITKSKQSHTDAIKELLIRYNIENPVKNDTVTVLKNETLKNLYNQLVQEGSKSISDALKVDATIEYLDIKDLQKFSKETDKQDIKMGLGVLRTWFP